MSTILYRPWLSVTTARTCSMRAGLDASTVTPGNAAPVVSVTAPAMPLWAHAEGANIDDARNTAPAPTNQFPGGVKNLDPLVIPIADVNPALRVGHHVVEHSKLAGTLSSTAPLKQIFPVARVLHQPSVTVAVAYVDIAIGREGHVGRQIEVV